MRLGEEVVFQSLRGFPKTMNSKLFNYFLNVIIILDWLHKNDFLHEEIFPEQTLKLPAKAFLFLSCWDHGSDFISMLSTRFLVYPGLETDMSPVLNTTVKPMLGAHLVNYNFVVCFSFFFSKIQHQIWIE